MMISQCKKVVRWQVGHPETLTHVENQNATSDNFCFFLLFFPIIARAPSDLSGEEEETPFEDKPTKRGDTGGGASRQLANASCVHLLVELVLRRARDRKPKISSSFFFLSLLLLLLLLLNVPL